MTDDAVDTPSYSISLDDLKGPKVILAHRVQQDLQVQEEVGKCPGQIQMQRVRF